MDEEKRIGPSTSVSRRSNQTKTSLDRRSVELAVSKEEVTA
jgi:hypothetical protein